MLRRFKIYSRCEGATAVELAIILPLFIFLIFGAMDLAHAFYIEHIITTASREGARYGAKYTGNPPVDPTQDQITAYVTSTLVTPLDDLVVNSPVYTTVPGPQTIELSLLLLQRISIGGYLRPLIFMVGCHSPIQRQ
jgi:hypothetical protein